MAKIDWMAALHEVSGKYEKAEQLVEKAAKEHPELGITVNLPAYNRPPRLELICAHKLLDKRFKETHSAWHGFIMREPPDEAKILMGEIAQSIAEALDLRAFKPEHWRGELTYELRPYYDRYEIKESDSD